LPNPSYNFGISFYKVVGNKKLEQLIAGIKVRDHRTLTEIYKEYFPKVLGYIVKNGGTEEDAKDIFQEAIMVIYKLVDANKLEIDYDFGNFLIGISKRIWLKHLRSADIHERYVQHSEHDSSEDHPSDVELENELELGLIRKYLLKLGEDCRNILMWSAEGFSNDEIAVKMNYKSEKTVRTKKYKCKSTLKELIKNDPEFKQR
jgi:RNA polymerase sigma factor (sigma-70 family)